MRRNAPNRARPPPPRARPRRPPCARAHQNRSGPARPARFSHRSACSAAASSAALMRGSAHGTASVGSDGRLSWRNGGAIAAVVGRRGVCVGGPRTTRLQTNEDERALGLNTSRVLRITRRRHYVAISIMLFRLPQGERPRPLPPCCAPPCTPPYAPASPPCDAPGCSTRRSCRLSIA